jgi:hypothetical protein
MICDSASLMRAVGPGRTRKIRCGEAWDLQGIDPPLLR